jgi:hypothetical protein
VTDRIPLPIAVTGHRDLHPDQLPAVRRALAGVFSALARAHPHSDLLLLTGLAEGADRLAAEVASEGGIDVVGVLPMPEALYRATFGDGATRFDAARQRCRRILELPVPEGDDVSTPGPARDACYARLGRWLTRSSFLVVALWDGEPGRGEGGTADVVAAELSGRHGQEADGLQDDRVGGTVCHILTRRADAEPPSGAPVRWLSEEDEVVVELAGDPLPTGGVFPLLRRLDELNREQQEADVAASGAVVRSAGWFVPQADQGALSPGQRALLRHYAVADATAQRYQRMRQRTLVVLSAVALAAVSALELYKEGLGTQRWALGVLLIYPLGMLLGWARLRWAKARGHDTRQLDYRALAEGLRIQLAWALVGVGEDVTDGYLHTLRGELQWVRGAIRACVLSARLTADDLVATVPAFELVQRCWVADQRAYFRRSVGGKEAQTRRHHRLIRGLFWTSFGASLALGPARILAGQTLLPGGLRVDGAFELSAAVALAAAAALSAFTDRLHLPELARQHDRMFLVFHRAERRLAALVAADDMERARGVIVELGRTALHENAAWVLLHRSRPLEAPGTAP